MPWLLCLSAGTRTLQLPLRVDFKEWLFADDGSSCRPWCRAARATRLSGGCGTPTKTMFQLAPVQLRHSLLREIHCCCGPASTLPSMSESDIQPPLAQPPF